MTTKYNLKQREALRGMRTGRDWIATIERALWIGLLLTAFATGWLIVPQLVERYVDERAANAVAAEERAQDAEAKAHKLLAHILNGRSLIDPDSGAVYFVQVSRQEGL